MRDYDKRLETTLDYDYKDSGGGGGVRCMKREGDCERRMVEGRQTSYSHGAGTDGGMCDRGRNKVVRGRGDGCCCLYCRYCYCCCCPCHGQGFSRHAVGMREEERRMTTGGVGRTKTTTRQQQQLHVFVSPDRQRYVITLGGSGSGVSGSCCSDSGRGSGGDIYHSCGFEGSFRIKRRVWISAFSGVKRKFKCPTGRHIHYANKFRQDDSRRCQCQFLNCDTSIGDVSLSDAICDIFQENADGEQRRRKCPFASRYVNTGKTTRAINQRKNSNSQNIGSIFNKRNILFHVVILLFYHLSSFSILANAAQTSPSSSSSSSSLKNNRYNLLSPSPSNSSSILIHFNPPSIKNLQINKPQTVFFNFTIYQRPWSPQPFNNKKNKNNSDKSNSPKHSGTPNITNQQKTATKDILGSDSSNNVNSKSGEFEIPLSDSAVPSSGGGAVGPVLQTTNTFLVKTNNNDSGTQPQTGSEPLTTTATLLSVQLPTTPNSNSPRNHSSSNSTPPVTVVNDATPGTFQQQQQPPPQQKHPPSRYWVMISSNDDSIARIKLSKSAGRTLALLYGKSKSKRHPRKKDKQEYSFLLMTVTPGRQYNFSVEAKHIGRTTMSLAVVDAGGGVMPDLPDISFKDGYVQTQTVASSQYDVSAVRVERTADVVFNSAAAAIAILISFGMGASTDMDCVKRQLKYPVSLIVGFCCQFIIMPVLAFGVAMALPGDIEDIRLGLLCTACVPGGGLGHIAVIIADGDTALSVTINLISVIAMLGTAPLWIFVLGQYFQTESDEALSPRTLPIFNFEVWLAASFLAYMAGLIIKRFRSPIADAILMWLIKPFLLLASILYITIGVYINMYVFDMMKEFALLGAMLLPFCGFVVGAGLAALCRQGNTFIKTIALETASLNCVVVLVALRFSLGQPDADLASMIPIWVLFTTPGLFVFLSICKRVKNAALHYWRNRSSGSKKDAELLGSMKAYSVSSSAVSPPGTTTLSAPLVVADGVDDDLTISTTSNQKVTVL